MSSVDRLRDFVNERLTAAAEEIFGVFRKTIVEYEEEIDRQRKLLDIFWKPEVKLHRIEPALINSNVTADEELQDTSTQPSTTEESKPIKSEVLGSTKVTADTKNNDKNYCCVLIDLKEPEDESLIQEVLFPSLEGVNSEQGQPEADVSYVQPVSSECSADEEWVQSKGAQTKKKRRKVLKRQNGSMKRKLLDIFWNPEVKLHRIAAEPALTISSVTAEEVLQETPEESKPSKSEVLGSTKVTADTENNSLEGVNSEQGQPEADVSYVQPASSECSADEEWVQSKGAQTKKKRQKVLKRQNGSMKQRGQTVLPDGDSSAKSQNGRGVSPICGKSFLSNHKKQVKTRKKTNETTKMSTSRGAQKKRFACDVCDKKFKNSSGLEIHSKLHKGIRDFKCQDCGKSFVQKEHLVVHMRTHSGERPYSCDTCGKLFYTRGHLKTHMKRLSQEKPSHMCDICGEIFCQRRQLVQHRDTHIAAGTE